MSNNSNARRPSNLGGFIQVDKETLNEIDYLDKLSPQDRAWFERFLDNEYNARFHKDGKDVVEQHTPEGRAANAYKQRRLYDFTNKFFKYDDPTSTGTQVLVPKPRLSHTSPTTTKCAPKPQPNWERNNPHTPEELLLVKEALLQHLEIHEPSEKWSQEEPISDRPTNLPLDPLNKTGK